MGPRRVHYLGLHSTLETEENSHTIANRVAVSARGFKRGCHTRRSGTKDLGEVACDGSMAREPELSQLDFCADGVDPSIGTVPSPRSCDTQERTHERAR